MEPILYIYDLFENPSNLYHFTNLIIFRRKRWARFSSRNSFCYIRRINSLKSTFRDNKRNSYDLFTHSFVRFNYCFGIFSSDPHHLLRNAFWLFFLLTTLKLHFIFSYTKVANSLLFLNVFFSKKLTSLLDPRLSTNFITKFKTSKYSFAFLFCFYVYSSFLPSTYFLYDMYFLYTFYKLPSRFKSLKLVSNNSTGEISCFIYSYFFHLTLVILRPIYSIFTYFGLVV